ncbi:MAG TPA: adenylate/guanylate cyclase domain-containing protein [Chitinophagales bacterium]|nr:adenylate/guanylate cyclase domain-containing protein [Chitinophagales bacterium]
MSPRNIRFNIFFQIICWTVAAWLYMVYRVAGLAEYERIRVIEPIRYNVVFIQSTIAGLAIGFILGILDIFLAHSKMRKRSFGFLVMMKGLIYIGSIILVISLIHFITGLFDGLSIQEEMWKLREFYQQGFLVSILVYALFISFLISFIKQVNQKFGPGILVPMLLGKYYKPLQEDRIFLFLDLRSSTTYAEKIGHVLYSELIQDCFYDLALEVEKYRAEIYQYVGDEAILTWKLKTGLLDNNCLRITHAFNEQLQSRSAHYMGKYGVVPEFKGGVNSGLVMVAEIGEIKKEIAYHGDVLNTASRIQSQCNLYGKNLLISEQLKNLLPKANDLKFELIGTLELKGKKELVSIYSVERSA